MSNIWIGWDNGVGTIAIIKADGTACIEMTPIRRCLSYTKAKNYISRIDVPKVLALINGWLTDCNDRTQVHVGIERPFTSHLPIHKKGVVLGARMHEAQLIIVEDLLKLSYEFIDSGQWQKNLLPSGIKGSVELKKASLEIGKRKWPHLVDKMKKDADALFIAEYLRQQGTRVL
jgi:hypothetical protein